MKKNILVMLLMFAMFTLSACKKFLEEQSQSDVIPKTAQALNEMMIGAVYTNSGRPPYNATQRLIDDDIMHIGVAQQSFEREYAYTWQPENASPADKIANPNVWGGLFGRITSANIVLDYLPKVSGTTAEIENVAGQAYLMRAYYYFMLVNYFGKPYNDHLSNPEQDLGVPIMLSGNLSLEGSPRNTVAEVYQQILSDLDKGIPMLERSGKNNNLFRISPTAGYLLASRVHLYMGNWQKAIDATTSVLARKSDLMNLSTLGAANNETKPIVDLKNVETIWGHGDEQSVSRAITGNGEELSYRLSDELVALYENGDLRNGIYFSNKISLKRTSLSALGTVAEAFRVSEAFLNRAEAYAQLNKLGQTSNAQLALNDLNTLRKNRFSTTTYQALNYVNADDLLQKCRLEKRREYFGEEAHRWFDLRRSGMPAIRHLYHVNNTQTLTYTLQERDPYYVLPIPQNVLDKNPKLIPNPIVTSRPGQ